MTALIWGNLRHLRKKILYSFEGKPSQKQFKKAERKQMKEPLQLGHVTQEERIDNSSTPNYNLISSPDLIIPG